MSNSFHNEAVTAVRRCEEINIRRIQAVRKADATLRTATGWALVTLFIGAMLAASLASAERHYAQQSKINQENVLWQKK